MAEYRIRVRPGELSARIQAHRTAARRAFFEAAIESATRTIPRVRAASPVDQGEYKNSWQVVPVNPAGKPALVELRNDAPHAGVIELGARPFFPPIGPLIDWVERKFGDLKGQVSFGGRSTLSAAERSEAYGIARAIQRKIGERGLPALRVLGKQLPFMRRTMRKAYERRIATMGRRS
jgi:hypothetical protein